MRVGNGNVQLPPPPFPLAMALAALQEATSSDKVKLLAIQPRFGFRLGECGHFHGQNLLIVISSHILMIAIVLAFSVHFYSANRKQKAGKRLLERTVRWQNSTSYGADDDTGRFPVHLLTQG